MSFVDKTTMQRSHFFMEKHAHVYSSAKYVNKSIAREWLLS